MVLSLIGKRTRRIAGVTVLALAATMGCLAGTVGGRPEVATMLLLFPGNDTVIVDIATGEVTSGPIVLGADVDVSVEFFAEDGTPDGRVTEAAYRLDITPTDTGIVSFSRSTAFAGTFHKINAGSTTLVFALVQLSDTMDLFARSVPTQVY